MTISSFFVRISGPVAVLCFALATSGCVNTWDRLTEAVMPASQAAQEPDIVPIEIAALPDLMDMETASGGDPDRYAAVSHIERLGDDVLAALEISIADSDDREDIFRAILARDLDVELIAQFVLGRHWKEASADQQSRYTEVFANFLIQSYATRLGGIRIDHFEVQEAHAIGKNDFLVRSKVDRGARKTVRADWRVRESDTGFKIIDLSVSGISLALTLREEFASILRREGLDGLIQLLKERTV